MDSVNIDPEKYHHGDLRESLLQAGLRVLEDEGLEAVTIRRLAREVGVAHSAPANHFPNRKVLWTALAKSCFADLLAMLTNASEEISSKAIKGDEAAEIDRQFAIRRLARVTIRYGLCHPHRYRLMFRWDSLDREDRALNKAIETLYQLLLQALDGIYLAEGLADRESCAISLWSLVHGYTVLRIEGNLQTGVDTLSGKAREDAILDIWLSGLLGMEAD